MAEFASRFRVSWMRTLPGSQGVTRWLVRNASAQAETEQAVPPLGLRELVVLHAGWSGEEARLGFLELCSDEQTLSGAIQDVCIDPILGLAVLLDYQPSVALDVICQQRSFTAAECGSVLLASLALGVRARGVGFCTGEVSAQSFLLDAQGSIRLTSGEGLHAASRGIGSCCELGVSSSSLVSLALEVAGLPGQHLAETLRDQLTGASAEELPLEIALHVMGGEVTPQRLDLPHALGMQPGPEKSLFHPGFILNDMDEAAEVSSEERRTAEQLGGESLSSEAQVYRPRFASNAPSSSRFFIWVRNRAASAPSTMR